MEEKEKENNRLLKDLDEDLLTKLCLKHLKEASIKLTFIKDWGKFNDRKKYMLSDVEYKNKMENFSKEISMRIMSQLIAETFIKRIRHRRNRRF